MGGGTPYNPTSSASIGLVDFAKREALQLSRQLINQYKSALAKTDFGVGLVEVGMDIKFIASIAKNLDNASCSRSLSYDFFRNNIARAAEGGAIPGSSLTGVYDTMSRVQSNMYKEIAVNGMKSYGKSGKLLRKLSLVNLSDPESVTKHQKYITKVAADVLVRNKRLDHFKGYDFSDNADEEIAILLALKDTKSLRGQIKNYTSMMNNYIDAQTVTLRASANAIFRKYGITGNINVNTLNEAIKTAGLSTADRNTLVNLRNILVDKSKFADKYLLGRIATGEIDVNKVIASGKFCGVALTPEMEDTLLVLKMFASVGAINNDAHNDMLLAIGGSASKYKSVNLNSLRTTARMKKLGECGVVERAREFGAALDKAGISTPKGKAISGLSTKKLRKLVKSADFAKYSTDVQNAIKETLKLKEHAEQLKSFKSLKKSLTGQLLYKLKAGIKNTDMDAGITQIRKMKQMTRIAYTVALKSGKLAFRVSRFLYKHSPARFQRLMGKAAKPIKAALNSIRGLLSSIGGAINTAAKTAANAVGKAAKNAGKKIITKIKTTLPRTTSLIGKYASKVGKFVKTKANKLKAKAAQSGIAKLAGAKLALAKFLRALAKVLSKIMGVVLKVIVIVLAVSIFLTALGMFLVMISDSVSQLDDTLFGWLDGVEWTWGDKASDSDKKNILYATLYTLQDEEEYTLNVKNIMEKSGMKGNYYSYADPLNGFKRTLFTLGPEGAPPGSVMYYFFEKDDGTVEKIPITQYSNTKYAIGAAHAVTCPIETKEDLEIFSKYALGTWYYLNNSDVKVNITVCDGEGEYVYFCNGDDVIYDKIIERHQPGDEMPLEITNSTEATIDGDKLILVDDSLVKERTDGCRTTYYYGDKTFRTFDKNKNFALTSQGQQGDTIYFRNIFYSENAKINATGDRVNSSNPYARRIPGSNDYYMINPEMNSMCTEEITDLNDKEDTLIRRFLSETVTYHGTSTMTGCTNHGTIYCSGCIEETHYHENLVAPCSCEGCIATPHYYCAGHVGTTFCSTATIRDKNGSIQTNVRKAACDNCIAVVSETGLIYYKCLGHTGTVYCSPYELATPCGNSTTTYTYTCPGFKEMTCRGHDVCFGHYQCKGHNSCPGHMVTYCTGHIKYVVSEYIRNLVKNPDMLFNDWSYEVHTKKWIFTDIDRYTSNELEEATEFSGWTDDAKSAAYGIASQDWCRIYGLTCAEFQGGQCSPYEKEMVKERYNISPTTISASRMRIVDCALDCIGKIPYYPGGQAYGATYSTSFGLVTEPRTSADGVVHSNYGLDGKYFADWVYWSSNYNPDDKVPIYVRNPLLKEMNAAKIRTVKPTTNNLLPGDVIIRMNGSNITDSAIFLGYEALLSGTSSDIGACVVRMGADWSVLNKIVLTGSSWYKISNLAG